MVIVVGLSISWSALVFRVNGRDTLRTNAVRNLNYHGGACVRETVPTKNQEYLAVPKGSRKISSRRHRSRDVRPRRVEIRAGRRHETQRRCRRLTTARLHAKYSQTCVSKLQMFLSAESDLLSKMHTSTKKQCKLPPRVSRRHMVKPTEPSLYATVPSLVAPR